MIRRRLPGFIAGLVLAAVLAAPAEAQPRPPCDTAALPDYAPLDGPLAFRIWQPRDLAAPWAPPPCTHWAERDFSALIALAGRIGGVASTDDLLRRLGAVSRTGDVVYWSHSQQRWRPLFEETYALEGPEPDLRRDDFDPAELTVGRDYYLWQKENAAVSGTVLRVRFHEIAPDRLVLEQINVTGTRFLMVPLLDAGDYEALIFLTRERDDIWTYYHLIRYGDGDDAFTEGHRASLLNRADALFRYVGDLPPEPTAPLAP